MFPVSSYITAFFSILKIMELTNLHTCIKHLQKPIPLTKAAETKWLSSDALVPTPVGK
jgi:hypothetical protein